MFLSNDSTKLLFSAPVNDNTSHLRLMEQTSSNALLYTEEEPPSNLITSCKLPSISIPSAKALLDTTKVLNFPFEKSYEQVAKDPVVVSKSPVHNCLLATLADFFVVLSHFRNYWQSKAYPMDKCGPCQRFFWRQSRQPRRPSYALSMASQATRTASTPNAFVIVRVSCKYGTFAAAWDIL